MSHQLTRPAIHYGTVVLAAVGIVPYNARVDCRVVLGTGHGTFVDNGANESRCIHDARASQYPRVRIVVVVAAAVVVIVGSSRRHDDGMNE